MSAAHVSIHQHWEAETIVLSYVIASTGSFCTIQLMEQWRQYDDKKTKLFIMFLASVALGGCGIWCTHFTGMNALHLMLADASPFGKGTGDASNIQLQQQQQQLHLMLHDGTVLEMHYEVGLTILSFLFPVFGVFVGLFIASKDPFFLEIQASRRKELLVKELHKSSMKDVVKKEAAVRRIKYAAMFSRLWFTLAGGLFAAIGVLGMHYIGMKAERCNATFTLDVGIVALSCGIAFFTANAAFWIIFRALTFWPENEPLRLASALIMGIAVAGTHYTGMGAAIYLHSEEDYQSQSRFTIPGQRAAVVASHSSILICYWLTSLGVTASVKMTEKSKSRKDDKTSNTPNNNTSTHPTGKSLARGGTGLNTAASTAAPVRAKVYAVDTN